MGGTKSSLFLCIQELKHTLFVSPLEPMEHNLELAFSSQLQNLRVEAQLYIAAVT